MENSLVGTPFESFLEMQRSIKAGEVRVIFSSYARSRMNDAACYLSKNARLLMFLPYLCSIGFLSVAIFVLKLSWVYISFFLLSIIVTVFYHEGLISLSVVLVLSSICLFVSAPNWMLCMFISVLGAMIGVNAWWSKVRKILYSSVLFDANLLQELFESGVLALKDPQGNFIMRHIESVR